MQEPFRGDVEQPAQFGQWIGVVVGTYSTVFIASPVFLALETRAQRKAAADEAAASSPAARPSS